jgi:2-hydroxychromene-2-carboxylate isomerase
LGLTRFLRRLEKRYRNAEGLPITLSVDLFFSFRSPYSYLALQAEGRSLEFVHAIAPVLWDGSVAGWNEGDHLARAAAVAGFDLAAMDAAVIADADRYERIIAGNEQDHAASGHWGVPTFVFENEPFFGQDRIDLLIWRMESKGLKRRQA